MLPYSLFAKISMYIKCLCVVAGLQVYIVRRSGHFFGMTLHIHYEHLVIPKKKTEN